MKKNRKKLEKSITQYFKKAELNADSESQYLHDDVFEQEKVYTNVLDIIEKKQKKTFLRSALKIAASIILISAISLSFYYYRINIPEQIEMVQKSAPKGKILKLSLTDGTTVFLNAGSTLTFPKSFAPTTREVTLNGEGFFNVAHNAQKPFIIHTDKINTQVLGTSFNINAYAEEENIKITVVTGKVSVYPRNDTSVGNTRFITKNQQLVYNKAKQRLSNTEEIINTSDLVAWSEGKMVYRDQLLTNVIKEVERRYNINIEIPKHLNSCRITVNFDNSSLEKVLKVLSKIIDGEVKYKDGIYLFNGKGC